MGISGCVRPRIGACCAAYNGQRQPVLKDCSPETVLRQRVDADPSLSEPGDNPPELGGDRRIRRMVARAETVSHPGASGAGIGSLARSEWIPPAGCEPLAGFEPAGGLSPSERSDPAVTLPSVPNSAPNSSSACRNTITVNF
ncbi:hypothetical protein G3T14_14560 [Methylobacterium sp. BTF04]|uniref:hypothetical protein n=1 Tax=Methylobacterium sp. BTF04 TaxID=2708300 RepID=UPI0013D3CB7E|nr:hypothetical protein [Methylobacterium sp. BTF04]NEU13343.1 hypothetical protein [Methylobacterium sp. BTF04]